MWQYRFWLLSPLLSFLMLLGVAYTSSQQVLGCLVCMILQARPSRHVLLWLANQKLAVISCASSICSARLHVGGRDFASFHELWHLCTGMSGFAMLNIVLAGLHCKAGLAKLVVRLTFACRMLLCTMVVRCDVM